MGQSSSRLGFVDIAKALAIFSVVLCHVVYNESLIKIFTMAFNMPLFFLLSGMFISLKEGTAFRTICVLKFKHLMIPFFLWGCIYSQVSIKNLIWIFYGSHETLLFAGSLTSLWFLPVMFLSYILCYFVLKETNGYMWVEKRIAVIIVFVVISYFFPHHSKYGMFWGVDIAFMACAFMLVGNLFFLQIKKLSRQKMHWKVVTFFIFCFLFCSLFRYSTTSKGCVLMCDAMYGNYGMFLLNALTGSGMVLTLAMLIDNIHRKSFLMFVGQNTLGIFLVHKPIALFFRDVATCSFQDFNYAPIAICTAVIVLYISTGLVFFIKKYLPFLLAVQIKQE